MMNRNVLHLTCPPIPVLRIGFVGLGNRGILALERYMHLEGVEVKALCDLRPRNIERATALLHRFNRPAAGAGITFEEERTKKADGGNCADVRILTWFIFVPIG